MKRRVTKQIGMLTGYEPPSGNPPMPGNPGEWVPLRTTQYVWDGWNIAAEIVVNETVGSTNIIYCTWGLDLSGTLQGAGGVGGLLAVIEGDGSVFFPCYDANGNITEYSDSQGAARGHYEYSAFGETTAQAGDLANSFTHRFSTKPFEVETGISKYQQRDYIPPLSRWANRDPIEEEGGVNLYGFVENNPCNDSDFIGLDQISLCSETHPSEPNAVYWVVVNEDQRASSEIKVGTIDSRTSSVTMSGEYDNRRFDFWELTRIAGAINSRFGYLNSLDENVQKSAIKLAVKHPKTPSTYRSLDEAGIWGAWLARGKSHGNGWEWAAWIIGSPGNFVLGDLVTSRSGETVRLWVLDPIANNPNIAGWFHNHPSGGESTSVGDKSTQRLVKRLTKSDETPSVFSAFGFALSPKGIVIKTEGSSDVTVYP